jgi:hypothetical protein
MWGYLVASNEQPLEDKMKLFPIAAVVIACALAPLTASAQTATPAPANKVDCEKAKMKWDEKGGKDAKGACVAAPAKADTTKK